MSEQFTTTNVLPMVSITDYNGVSHDVNVYHITKITKSTETIFYIDLSNQVSIKVRGNDDDRETLRTKISKAVS